MTGVRIDGVHSGPSRLQASFFEGHKIGVAAKDGRLRIAAHRSAETSADGAPVHVRRGHSVSKE
jgi:hypothetical protein